MTQALAALTLLIAIAAGLAQAQSSGAVVRLLRILETSLGRYALTTPELQMRSQFALTNVQRTLGRPLTPASNPGEELFTTLTRLNSRERETLSKMDDIRSLDEALGEIENSFRLAGLSAEATELSQAGRQQIAEHARLLFAPKIGTPQFIAPIIAPITVLMPHKRAAHEFVQLQSSTQSLQRRFSLAEIEENLAFLSEKYGVPREEMLNRLAQSQITLEEALLRAQGGSPLSPNASRSERFLDQIAWSYKDRKIANPDFIRVMSLFIGVGLCTVTTSQYYGRGEKFWDEIDYFTADIITFALVEVVLNWVTARRVSSALTLRGKPAVPDTIFDRGFSATARAKVFAKRALVLGSTGMVMGIVGNGSVQIYRGIQERDDPNAPTPLERLETTLWKAALVGAFLGGLPPVTPLSSNFRYQIMTNLNIWLRTRLAQQHMVVRDLISTGVILANNTIGSNSYFYYQKWMNEVFTEVTQNIEEDLAQIEDSPKD